GTADVGESIFVLGYPMTNSMGKEVKLTNGIISAKTGFDGDVTSYQVSASVQPGNSGGPLFDKDGNILGVINARHNLAENATYAIKIGYLRTMLDLLPAPLQLPTTNSLIGLSLPEQVKRASRYTCLLEVSHAARTETLDEPFAEAMALLSEAEDAIAEEEYEVARSLIDQSIALLPENPAAYMLRGFMQLYHQQAFHEAIPDFNRVIALEPDNSVAYFHRGYALNALEKEEEALRDFNKTLALDADDADAYYMRAGIYIARDKYAEAIADFNQILRRETSTEPFIFKMALVYHHKAYCLLRLDKPAEALPVVNKALEMDKEKAFIWDTRGQIYFELEQYANCIKDMNKALSIEEAASSFFFRGLARLNLDQTADACLDLLSAGELGISEAYDIASEWCDPEKILASSAASNVPAQPATNASDSRQAAPTAPPRATPTYSEMRFPGPLPTTTKRAGLLWAQPSYQGKSLLNLSAQTSLQAIGYANGFWKVQVNGTIGFLDEQTIYITFGMRDAIQKK
ncbi:MAG: tetratricopeptide repeat-containing serine protease family protein, partial [Haliscomenobacter sp.]